MSVPKSPQGSRKAKNVIITGASRGLGKAMAEKFAENDHRLFLSAHHASSLYQTMEELLRKHPALEIKAKPFDLSVKQEVLDLGQWVIDEIQKRGAGSNIDILVNNAGQFLPGNVHNEEEGVLEKMVEVNLYSAYHLTRKLLPGMMSARSGHIFNICSIASIQAYPGGGSYSISKFALSGFSKNLREEMKPYGIKVTGVYPGAVYTDSWSESGIHPGRIMDPDDVAQLVYAASELSAQAVVEEILLRPQEGDI
jgi:short-subunit dehydrogenase